MRIALIALILTLSGCAAPKSTPPPREIVHVVVCWLNEPGDNRAKDRIRAATKSFEELPGVVRTHVGPRLPLATTRPIDDTTFDLAVVMVFRDEQSLVNYQRSPEHQQAVREVLQPLTRKVVVYDFVDLGWGKIER